MLIRVIRSTDKWNDSEWKALRAFCTWQGIALDAVYEHLPVPGKIYIEVEGRKVAESFKEFLRYFSALECWRI